MLAFAIIGHMVGDYLLQNDAMVAGKKRSSLICAMHCFFWTLAVLAFSRWPWWTFAPLFVTHFAQDRTNFVAWYMRFNAQVAFAKPPLAPWSIIVVDNTFHLVALAIIARLV